MAIAECENAKLLVLNVEMTSTNKNTSSPLKVEVKGKSSRDLLFYREIPAWYQDNIYIHYGYRPIMESIRTCFESWTYIHNEIVNIYSHLLPGVLAIVCQGLLFQYFSWSYPQATARDRIMLAFYLCTTSICFGFSALYHTLLNHSTQIAALWGRIDYTGIIILIFRDFVSGIYVGCYCEPVLQITYWIMVRNQ
jgi:adiponectin receptor